VWFGLHTVNRPLLGGPVIYAANHTSFLDPLVLGACSLRRIVFVMTAVFYRMPLLAWFFEWMGSIPVEEGKPNRAMLVRSLHALEQGRAIAIFPEGGISRDGRLQAGKAGIASLILRAGVPVVPVSIQGTYEALSRYAKFPKPRTVRVRFGRPLPPEEFLRRPGEDRKAAMSRITGQVMQEIGRLSATES
jgi:1-acyl-sn-glycerol-3-phosphate acyltransferase